MRTGEEAVRAGAARLFLPPLALWLTALGPVLEATVEQVSATVTWTTTVEGRPG
jgi:hypothetical protein